jgi:hypothetical protein
MLLVDLKGSLKFIPEEGNLYTSNQLELNNPENKVLDQVKGTFAWDDEEKIEVMESEEIPMSSYQKALMETGIADGSEFKLKDTISNWPDFMYTRYHPRSINVVKKFEYREDVSTLDTFTVGRDLFKESFFEDDYCDKIRSYIEECDHCQGFQTFFDSVDGFAGLTIKSLEYLQDEYGKSILAIPLIPPKAKNFPFADEAMSDSIRLINLTYSYAKLYEHSSLIVPLSTMERGWRQIGEPRSFELLNYDHENFYHSSSIIATFLDTMSLRYRLKDHQLQSYLSNFCSELNIYNRKLCGAKMALPFSMNEKEDLIDFLDKFEGDLMQPLSPGTKIGSDRIIQSVTLRGVPKNRLKKPLEKAKDQMKLPAYKCASVSEMLQLYFQCNLYSSLSNVTAIENPLKIQSPFPHEIFDSRLNFNGFVKEFEDSNKQQVMEVPVMTAVQNSSEIFNTLDNLHSQVARIKIAKIPRFVDSNLESEEFKELLEELLNFKEQYEDNSFL